MDHHILYIHICMISTYIYMWTSYNKHHKPGIVNQERGFDHEQLQKGIDQ